MGGWIRSCDRNHEKLEPMSQFCIICAPHGQCAPNHRFARTAPDKRSQHTLIATRRLGIEPKLGTISQRHRPDHCTFALPLHFFPLHKILSYQWALCGCHAIYRGSRGRGTGRRGRHGGVERGTGASREARGRRGRHGGVEGGTGGLPKGQSMLGASTRNI